MPGAVQFLKFNGKNNSLSCRKINISRMAENENNNSTTGTTDLGGVHNNQINITNQMFLRSGINEERENELRSMYNIKDCRVAVTTIPHKNTNVDFKNEPTLVNCEEGSTSEKEEWHFDLDNTLDSESNSDWEQEYLNKSKKAKSSLNKKKNNKTVNLVENVNCPGSLQMKNNTNVSESSFNKSRNNSLKADKSTTKKQNYSIETKGSKASVPQKKILNFSDTQSLAKSQAESETNTITKYVVHEINNQIKQSKLQNINYGVESGDNGKDLRVFFVKLSAPTFPMEVAISSTSSGPRPSQSCCPDEGDDPYAQKSSIPHKTKRKILPKPPVVPLGLVTDGTSPHDSHDDEDDPSLLPLPDYIYHCKKCDKYFDIDKYLYHKRRTVCGGYRRKLKYQCDICGKRFPSGEKLNAHKNSHNNSRPFKCSECDCRFNSKIARHTHYRTIHLKIEKIRYLCYFCGYITPSREHLEAHEREHQVPEGTEVPKDFKCSACGKGYISRWQLGRHKKEHQLKKCTTCLAEFKTERQLRKHMEDEHSIASKTYICEECGKEFRHMESLRHHRKCLHLNVEELICDICNKSFKRKNNLKQHMITHSDERPLSCAQCGDRFKRLTHLKQHISAFHGDGRK